MGYWYDDADLVVIRLTAEDIAYYARRFMLRARGRRIRRALGVAA